MTGRPLVIAALAAVLSSCASAPPAGPAAPQYRAPWADMAKPDFRDLLVSYGAANLPTQRDSTLDRYLRSQTKTFDRYVAAKEVGVGVEPLQQEAVAEISAASRCTRSRSTATRACDTGRSAAGRTQGMSVVSKDYGFTDAEVWVSKVGWIMPATPDQAVRMLEKLSQVGGERKVAVALTYTLDRCDAVDSELSRLTCTGTIRAMYGYSSLDAATPDAKPEVELVRRGQG